MNENSPRTTRHRPARRRARATWRDGVRIGAGVLILLLGIAGLVLPFLQGVLLLIVAAFLLAPYSRRVRAVLARLEARFPRLATKARRMAERWGCHRPADE